MEESAKRNEGGRARGAPPAQALNREVVIRAALELIDRDGLERFSIRNLADQLGVYPTAVYWYVRSRNELMAQVVALAHRDFIRVRKRRDWRQVLRDLFHGFRAAIRAHPNIAPVVASQLVSNSHIDLELAEHILAALERAGLSGASLTGAYNSVVAAMVGFTVQEFAPIPAEDTAAWQASVRERLDSVEAKTLPTLARNLPVIGNQAFILRWENGVDAPMDRSFEVLIDIVVAGIEALARLSDDARNPVAEDHRPCRT